MKLRIALSATDYSIRILENELIKLQQFKDSDYSQLVSEIPNARFLLQWAGPKYSYPLDEGQLSRTLAKAVDKKPAYKVFKAIKSDTLETVGHIQLMNINYDAGSCLLGRVLIFEKYRCNGYGKEMVQEAIRIAFDDLDLNEIILGVFDFNGSAKRLYKKFGFSEFQFIEGARQFQNESWNLIRMRLTKNQWVQKNLCEPVPLDSLGPATEAG